VVGGKETKIRVRGSAGEWNVSAGGSLKHAACGVQWEKASVCSCHQGNELGQCPDKEARGVMHTADRMKCPDGGVKRNKGH
jgi:hypothetical protein